MERDADQATRDQNVKVIGQRQRDILEGDIDYGTFLIFPEASAHNGLYLHRFRRGAFVSELPIQPFILTFEWDSVSPGYDCIRGTDTGVLMSCELSLKKLYLDFLPVMVPNEYLFTEYRKTIPDGDKLERWEVYAHAMRDVMSEVGGFGLIDQNLRDKVALTKYMTGVTNEVTLSGGTEKTFYYPHDPTRTGMDKIKDFPPSYFVKETSRLTEKDFVKGKGKLDMSKLA